jgi:acetyl-CoA carboxylase biotin carboxyl carrier protein
VTSPFVGTFYRAPSPESPSFVEIGQAVKKGQIVCIVEAMKLMNEIESESDGKVAEILVKNGEHVEYGQKLFRIA